MVFVTLFQCESCAPLFPNMPLVYVKLKAHLLHINNSVHFLLEKLILVIGFCQCDLNNDLKTSHFRLLN